VTAAVAENCALPPQHVGESVARSDGEQQPQSVIARIDRSIRIDSAPGVQRFTCERSGCVQWVVALRDHMRLPLCCCRMI